MIITEMKPFGMIKSSLNDCKEIDIVSCDTCAKMCETGGEKKLNDLANRFEKMGVKVNKHLVEIACDANQIKDLDIKSNNIIVLACEAASFNLRKYFKNKKIVTACDTIGIGAWDEEGNMTLVKKF